MVDSPVVPGYASQATWTGAGLRANTSSRLLAVCIFRSTRMSIRSPRIMSATCSIGEPHRAAPDVGIAAEAFGKGIGTCHVGVAKDFELPVIVIRQQRNHKKSINMVAKPG